MNSVKTSFRKGEVLNNIFIETMAAEGKCVARLPNEEVANGGLVLFIDGGVPGDTVNVELTKIKNHFLEGKVLSIVKDSINRLAPFCNHFGLCGGCKWQHLDYPTQLIYKQKQVSDALERIGGLTLPEIKTITPSQKTQFYRNRLDFTFTANRWLTKEELNAGDNFGQVGLGFHIPKMFDRVFDLEKCFLQPDPSNRIRDHVKKVAIENNIPFFDIRKQIGFLRTLTIRNSNEGETMVILQVAGHQEEWLRLVLDSLHENFKITSLNYVVNEKKNDTFSDLEIVCYKGIPYITERMNKPDDSGNLFFRVGPKSFYQTNSDQAYELYKATLKMADLKGDELVFDLYTGTGTIANFISSKAKKVIGLEYVPSAIEDAKVNSSLNENTNLEFFAGDIKDLLNESFLNLHGRPDVVITDPPRNGMHEDVCKMLLKAAPQKIVYVSCNPATQARDLAILNSDYSISEIQPVDMFPHTIHVENIVRLDRMA
jgi:23S rRNA (uracil1939-C5)-methyltransferase